MPGGIRDAEEGDGGVEVAGDEGVVAVGPHDYDDFFVVLGLYLVADLGFGLEELCFCHKIHFSHHEKQRLFITECQVNVLRIGLAKALFRVNHNHDVVRIVR